MSREKQRKIEKFLEFLPEKDRLVEGEVFGLSGLHRVAMGFNTWGYIDKQTANRITDRSWTRNSNAMPFLAKIQEFKSGVYGGQAEALKAPNDINDFIFYSYRFMGETAASLKLISSMRLSRETPNPLERARKFVGIFGAYVMWSNFGKVLFIPIAALHRDAANQYHHRFLIKDDSVPLITSGCLERYA